MEISCFVKTFYEYYSKQIKALYLVLCYMDGSKIEDFIRKQFNGNEQSCYSLLNGIEILVIVARIFSRVRKVIRLKFKFK